MIGLSSAYQLALRGVEVTVLEEKESPGQASGLNSHFEQVVKLFQWTVVFLTNRVQVISKVIITMPTRWQAFATEQSSASPWPHPGQVQNSLRRIPARCKIAWIFLKRQFPGEKDAGEPGSLVRPTVLALGRLVLVAQPYARMGQLQPPVPQVWCANGCFTFANEQLIKAHIEKLFTVGLNLAWALNCYQVARPVQPAVPGGGGDEAGRPDQLWQNRFGDIEAVHLLERDGRLSRVGAGAVLGAGRAPIFSSECGGVQVPAAAAEDHFIIILSL